MATLAELRTQIRERTDQTDSTFIEDAELNRFINQSQKELYDLLVSSNEDYYTNDPVSFTVASGSDTFSLPADFYKLRGVDISLNGNADEFTTVRPFEFGERNRANTSLVRHIYGRSTVRYRLRQNKLAFVPKDKAPGEYRLWYIPRAPDLVNDTDTFDGINGWEEYIIVDASIKIMQKEESDASIFLAQKAELRQRIEALAERDQGFPEKITDVQREYFDHFDER